MTTLQATTGGYKAVSVLYNALMTGLVLTLVSRRGEEAAAKFVFGHFRKQHLEKFLHGVTKLGLDGLPDAVICAQYHYFSNAVGGVKTEYVAESDEKAWVRYPPPRWIWKGAAICGVPLSVNEAMLHGWHGHNGVSLGNPRLGFVCTGQTVGGDPGLEGYYFDYGREISEAERVRFAPDKQMPDFDPAKAPKLDVATWPAERLMKVERSYAMEYVRSLVPVMLDLFGPAETDELLGATAKLIGMQFHDDVVELLPVEDDSAASFAQLLGEILVGQGETVEVRGAEVHQTGWRLMQEIDAAEAAAPALARMWEGLAAVHNRHLRLTWEQSGDGVLWRVV